MKYNDLKTKAARLFFRGIVKPVGNPDADQIIRSHMSKRTEIFEPKEMNIWQRYMDGIQCGTSLEVNSQASNLERMLLEGDDFVSFGPNIYKRTTEETEFLPELIWTAIRDPKNVKVRDAEGKLKAANPDTDWKTEWEFWTRRAGLLERHNLNPEDVYARQNFMELNVLDMYVDPEDDNEDEFIQAVEQPNVDDNDDMTDDLDTDDLDTDEFTYEEENWSPPRDTYMAVYKEYDHYMEKKEDYERKFSLRTMWKEKEIYTPFGPEDEQDPTVALYEQYIPLRSGWIKNKSYVPESPITRVYERYIPSYSWITSENELLTRTTTFRERKQEWFNYDFEQWLPFWNGILTLTDDTEKNKDILNNYKEYLLRGMRFQIRKNDKLKRERSTEWILNRIQGFNTIAEIKTFRDNFRPLYQQDKEFIATLKKNESTADPMRVTEHNLGRKQHHTWPQITSIYKACDKRWAELNVRVPYVGANKKQLLEALATAGKSCTDEKDRYALREAYRTLMTTDGIEPIVYDMIPRKVEYKKVLSCLNIKL